MNATSSIECEWNVCICHKKNQKSRLLLVPNHRVKMQPIICNMNVWMTHIHIVIFRREKSLESNNWGGIIIFFLTSGERRLHVNWFEGKRRAVIESAHQHIYAVWCRICTFNKTKADTHTHTQWHLRIDVVRRQFCGYWDQTGLTKLFLSPSMIYSLRFIFTARSINLGCPLRICNTLCVWILLHSAQKVMHFPYLALGQLLSEIRTQYLKIPPHFSQMHTACPVIQASPL